MIPRSLSSGRCPPQASLQRTPGRPPRADVTAERLEVRLRARRCAPSDCESTLASAYRQLGSGPGSDAAPPIDAPPGQGCPPRCCRVERHAAPPNPAPMPGVRSNADRPSTVGAAPQPPRSPRGGVTLAVTLPVPPGSRPGRGGSVAIHRRFRQIIPAHAVVDEHPADPGAGVDLHAGRLRASWESSRGSRGIWQPPEPWLNRCSTRGVEPDSKSRTQVATPAKGRAAMIRRSRPRCSGVAGREPHRRGKVDGKRNGEGLLGGGEAAQRPGPASRSRRPSGGRFQARSPYAAGRWWQPPGSSGHSALGQAHQLGPILAQGSCSPAANWAVAEHMLGRHAARQPAAADHPGVRSSPSRSLPRICCRITSAAPQDAGLMLTSPRSLPVRSFLSRSARGGIIESNATARTQ